MILLPIGLILKLFGWDPLRRRSTSTISYWVQYNLQRQDPRHFEKLY
jgi:hypothetical protein